MALSALVCNCTCIYGQTLNTEYCISDIDECQEETDNCDINAECSNAVGSFTCSCNVGFTGDGRSCCMLFFRTIDSDYKTLYYF